MARTPATALVWAAVFVGPDTTVYRVEGSRSLQVFSEYLGIDTTTGSCPAAMSAQSPDLWSPVAIRRRVRRVLPLCRQGTPLVAERVVRRDERAGTELEKAAARAERTGVHGVVPDHVEEPSHRRLRGRVVPGDRQGATVGRARRTGSEARSRFSEKRLASSMTWLSRGGLVIAEQEGWTSAKVGTLGEHLAGRAFTLVSVTQGPENLGTATFKIVGAPHMTPYMVSIGP